MSFALELSSLSTKFRRKILKRYRFQPKKTQYDDNPACLYTFLADKKNDTLHLPLGEWEKYLDEFPNDDHSLMHKSIKFNAQLLTPETDPSGRNRDQVAMVKECLKRLRKVGTVFVASHTGYGKCLAPGTEVLMFDGTKKVVEDIEEGDVIMGDDSTPRNILSVCAGDEEMFEVIPTKGESFTVNRSHILSLKASGQGRISQEYRNHRKFITHWFDGKKCISKMFDSREDALKFSNKIILEYGDTFDISIDDYLKLNASAKHILKCFWTAIDYPHKDVPIPARLIGIWLGDGTSLHCDITTIDPEITDYINWYAEKNDLKVREVYQKKTKAVTYCMNGNNGGGGASHTNYLLTKMQKLNLIGNKHIPLIYKANSRKVRLELLAGLIDTDGYYNSGCYEITQKSKVLSYDIVDLCRSLGFGCFITKVKKSCMYKNERREGTYYRVVFSGNGLEDIPVLLERKKAAPRLQKKNPLVTGFKLVSKGVGEYYGFIIDGNHRFVLGNHMVTHNTSTAIYMCTRLKLKTLIVCHLDGVRKQWPDEFYKFCGVNVRIQMIKGKNYKIDKNADVYIIGATKATLMQPEDFEGIGTVIIDEAHLVTSSIFTKVTMMVKPRYLIGLSATPDRNDGLDALLTPYFGDYSEFVVRKETKKFTVYKMQTPFQPEVRYTIVKGRSVPDWNHVINTIEGNEKRWKFIADIVSKNPNEKMIVLCNRNCLANGVYDILVERGEDVCKYIGTGKRDTTRRVCIAGMKKGGTGLNDPDLTAAIIASDTKDVRQYEGRIRTINNKIFHIVDNYKTFEKHWDDCEDWYLQKGADIVECGIEHSFDNKTVNVRRMLPPIKK